MSERRWECFWGSGVSSEWCGCDICEAKKLERKKLWCLLLQVKMVINLAKFVGEWCENCEWCVDVWVNGIVWKRVEKRIHKMTKGGLFRRERTIEHLPSDFSNCTNKSGGDYKLVEILLAKRMDEHESFNLYNTLLLSHKVIFCFLLRVLTSL